MLLLLPLLLLWTRAPMEFSLPWRWALLGLLGASLLQLPLPAAAAQDTTPWLVRSTAAPQSRGGASPPPVPFQPVQPAAPASEPVSSPGAAPLPVAVPSSGVAPAQIPLLQRSVEQHRNGPSGGSIGEVTAVGRQREGTPLRSTAGRFVEIGRRWTFVTDAGERTYRVLENLALERVVTAIRHDAGDDRWSIDATVTEFSGENYLLLGRVRRSTADAAVLGSSGQPAGSSSTTTSSP